MKIRIRRVGIGTGVRQVWMWQVIDGRGHQLTHGSNWSWHTALDEAWMFYRAYYKQGQR